LELEGSLPCSQEPATGPYSEPDESNSVQNFLLYFSEIHIILSSHLHLGLPSGLFPSGFPTKIYTNVQQSLFQETISGRVTET